MAQAAVYGDIGWKGGEASDTATHHFIHVRHTPDVPPTEVARKRAALSELRGVGVYVRGV